MIEGNLSFSSYFDENIFGDLSIGLSINSGDGRNESSVGDGLKESTKKRQKFNHGMLHNK